MAPPVIFTCFAGRERYMRVLIPYIRKLAVDQVHIWDYTRCESDGLYLKNNCSGFSLFSVKDKSNYGEYYRYYTKERFPDPFTVIVKCDDDIVFIDTSAFDDFIKARRVITDAVILSPVVVNNPICDIIQFDRKVIPEPSHHFFGVEAPCHEYHSYFLNNPAKYISDSRQNHRFFVISKPTNRFNINFFAVLAKDLDILFQNEYIVLDDERFLGAAASNMYGRPIVVDLYFVVCHMAYTAQRENGYDETEQLKRYSMI